MILKKPYAFLIKHFKLMHLILCALLIYIAFKCNDILYYFTDYINAGYYIKIGDVVGDYISIYLYISLFLVLVFELIILVLLHVKDKKNLAYVLAFVIYIVITGLVINGHLNLLNMQLEIIDFRKVRIYKDMLFVSMFVQYIIIIFTLMRGLGFNIKQFNFENDLEELNISSTDNEEFEFTVDLNTNSFSRKLRSKRRHLKYYFIEHKNIFVALGSLIVLFASIITFINLGVNFAHNENTVVKINNNTIVVNNSYITDKNYKGSTINNQYKYLIVNFDIKNTGEENNNLDLDKFKLLIEDKIYSPIKNEEKNFFDFGEYYKEVMLKPNTVKNYILVFKIPKNDITAKKYIFRYSVAQIKKDTTISKNFDVKLKPIEQLIDQDIIAKKIGEELVLDKSILGKTKLLLNSYEISDSFNTKYKYCISNQCSELTKLIVPNNLMNNNKTIIKLNLDIQYDNKITSNTIKNQSYLISNLSKISYVLDDKLYEDNQLLNLTPTELNKGKDIYLEVDSNIKKATKISIIIDIRGSRYTYNILE